jgi:hypothetical protein
LQRLSVSGQLAKLELTWAMGESVDGDDSVDRGSQDDPADSLREELLGSLALRELLDHDLQHRGVSKPRGDERPQVALRVRVSRDLVRLADRIRTQARRAVRSDVAPMSAWDVAREVAFDASQHPRDVIAAVRHLLTNRPPRVTSPEVERWQEEARAMSEAELDAKILELEAADNEPQATPGPDTGVGSATKNELERSEALGTGVVTSCLEILQRIGDGLDPRASGRDRIRAAELREQHLAATNPRKLEDALWDKIMSWTEEELDRELESLLDEPD